MGYPTPPPDYDYAGEKEAHTPYPVPKHVTRDPKGVKVYSSPYALPENMQVLDRDGYEKELTIAKQNAKTKDEKYALGNFYVSYPYQVYFYDGKFHTAKPGEYIPIAGTIPGAGAGTMQALPQLLPYVYFVSEAFDSKLGKFFKYGVACEVSDLMLGNVAAATTKKKQKQKPADKPPNDGLWRNADGNTVNGPYGTPIENKPGFYPVFDKRGWMVLGPDNEVVYLPDNLVPVYDKEGGVVRNPDGTVKTEPRGANADIGLVKPADATRAEQLAQKSIYYDSYLAYINEGKKNGKYYEKRGALNVVYEVEGNGITPPRQVVTRQMIVTGEYDPGFWKRVEKEIGELAKDLENFTEGLVVDLVHLADVIAGDIIGFLFDHPILLIGIVAIGGFAVYTIVK